MLEKEIKKKIFKKLEAMDESLSYDLDSLIELKADIQTIYLLFFMLHKKNEGKEQNEK